MRPLKIEGKRGIRSLNTKLLWQVVVSKYDTRIGVGRVAMHAWAHALHTLLECDPRMGFERRSSIRHLGVP